MSNDSIIAHVKAAITQESATRSIADSVKIQQQDGRLILEGGTASVAVKRAALVLASKVAGQPVVDELWVEPATPHPDDKLLADVCTMLQEKSEFRTLAVTVLEKGREEVLQQPADESAGHIQIQVENGNVIFNGAVVTLSHMRLIEGVTWWVPGVRNVTNNLTISTGEEDNDEQIAEAVDLLIVMDMEIPDGQVSVRAQDGVVHLKGLLFFDGQKDKAEQDAWATPGVRGVVNQIMVQHP